jgi:hypothetical protein
MEDNMTHTKIVFKASRTFVAIFYTFLLTWTVISVPLLIGNFSQISNAWLGMTVFIISITWYWSLGIVYSIVLEDNDIVRMKSLRRDKIFHINDFRKIEGPPSRIEFGFIRFRVSRDTIYAFFNSSETLRYILTTVKHKSTGTLFARFSSDYFNPSLP